MRDEVTLSLPLRSRRATHSIEFRAVGYVVEDGDGEPYVVDRTVDILRPDGRRLPPIIERRLWTERQDEIRAGLISAWMNCGAF